MASKLKPWGICAFLQPEFISQIQMVLVFGELCNSCIIVTKKRMVYGLGNNYGGCLGIDTSKDNITHPEPISALNGKDIKTLTHYTGSSGKVYVAALIKTGVVYAWGRHGQFDSPPVVLEGVKNVVEITCGSQYSLALTENGLIYRWNHQLNIKSFKLDKVNSTGTEKFVAISSSNLFSTALTDKGDVYEWRPLREQEFNYTEMFWEKRPISGVSVEKVVCGQFHSLALTTDGYVYGSGSNSDGQLGTENQRLAYLAWQKIKELKDILDIAASPQCCISVAMGMNCKIYIWGNCLKQCIHIPILIKEPTIHDVFARYATPNVMYQQLIINDKEEGEDCEDNVEPESLLDHLKAIFDHSGTSDFVIEVQGMPIYVHKDILKIRSLYFRAMFKTWSEKEESVMKVDDFSYDVYRAFLEYLYTNEFYLPIGNVEELLRLADYLDEQHLKARCESLLIGNISFVTLPLMYILARACNATMLRTACVNSAVHCTFNIVNSPIWKQASPEMWTEFLMEVNKVCNIFKT
ncbi:RCC1 and BTB domain-containing protein 1-like [Augochlora pura]